MGIGPGCGILGLEYPAPDREILEIPVDKALGQGFDDLDERR